MSLDGRDMVGIEAPFGGPRQEHRMLRLELALAREAARKIQGLVRTRVVVVC